jgi:ABC-2 type transport system ATP-binding protein
MALATHTDEFVLETDGLTKRFGEITAVDHVELRVPRGSAFGYLGPNGAGKTTLIRMLLGLTEASEGQMTVLGRPVPAERDKALARVGAIVEEPRFYGHMTGRQNLYAVAAARGSAAAALIEPSLDRVGLTARGDDRVATYSMGMRQRLGIAACLLADPELLILDEPMNGLDPAGILEIRGMIRSFVEEGRTVVLSSHLLDEVEKTCDAVAIVDHGRIIVQGSIADLAAGSAHHLVVATGDNERARGLLLDRRDVSDVAGREPELTVAFANGAPIEALTAAIVQQLVQAQIPVYRVDPEQATLEERFLQVTSRLGDTEPQHGKERR